MRIVFIASCLEPGQDGVGDYTRRLAAECIRQGHPTIIVGLNDPKVSEPLFVEQAMEGTPVSVLRLPSMLPWNERVMVARKWVDAFNPDWVSLQFVSFGFHRKGLPFGLGKRLVDINSKASWHIMFHELWLGLADDSSVKHRLWGVTQRRIVRDLIRRLHPQMAHTQAEPYQKALSWEGIKASILPLFGNIPLVKGDGWEILLGPLVTQAAGKYQDRTKLYLAGVFGAVHPEWNMEQTINTLLPLVQRCQKRLVLVFIGKNNLTSEAFDKLKSTLGDRATMVAAGERTDVEISKILQALNLGLATSPSQMIQKSGSVAAMLEHGLPVLVTRNDWHLRGTISPPLEMSSRILSPKQFGLLETLPASDHQLSGESNVKQIADRMLAGMKSSLSARELAT